MCFAALGAGLASLFGGGLSTVATLAGAGVSAVGALASASAQSKAAQASADQNNRNAIIADRNAADARERGIAAEQDQQIRTRARIGMQKNVMSERNIATGVGSPLDIIGDTAMFGKLDALTTRQNAEREAISHEAQGMNFRGQAEVDRMQAKNAKVAGGLSAFSTVLGGFSKLK